MDSINLPFVNHFILTAPWAVWAVWTAYPTLWAFGCPSTLQEPAGFWTAAPNNVWRDNARALERIYCMHHARVKGGEGQ